MNIANTNSNRNRFERLFYSLLSLIKQKFIDNILSQDYIIDILISLDQQFVDRINLIELENYFFITNYNFKDHTLLYRGEDFLVNSITYFLLIKLTLIEISEFLHILETEIKNIIIILNHYDDNNSVGVKQWEILQDIFQKISVKDRKKLKEVYRNSVFVFTIFQDFDREMTSPSRASIQKYSLLIRENLKKCPRCKPQFLLLDDYDRWVCLKCSYKVFRRKGKNSRK